MENHLRSIAKAASYRLFGSVVTLLIGWIVTGSLRLGIGICDVFAKIAAYYVHERIWHKIRWGTSAPAVQSNANGGGI